MKHYEAVFGVSGEQVLDTAELVAKAIPWVVGIPVAFLGILAVIGAFHPKFRLPPQ